MIQLGVTKANIHEADLKVRLSPPFPSSAFQGELLPAARQPCGLETV